jgi:two-component system, LytTR family, response regulator LytT
MKVLIVEDEPIAAQRLRDMLRSLDKSIEVVEVLDSVESSIDYFRRPLMVDLVFMDIELGDGQSFDIFERVNIEVPVIFITAYQQHALKAFKQNSIDYLLKPLRLNELEAALLKYRRVFRQNGRQQHSAEIRMNSNSQQHSPVKNRFLTKLGTRLVSVPVHNIAYFYTKDKLFFIKTKANEDLHFDKCLDDVEAEVDSQVFFRANRQFILHYSSIERVYAWFGGKLKVQVNPQPYEEIIISRLRAAEFKRWLGE